MNDTIHFPTETEIASRRAEFIEHQRKIKAERAQAVALARPALQRCVAVCAANSGQSYKVRALLFSAWNGKRADLSELLSLDWCIKQDVLVVLLAFGANGFFYDEIAAVFREHDLFDWFIKEGDAK